MRKTAQGARFCTLHKPQQIKCLGGKHAGCHPGVPAPLAASTRADSLPRPVLQPVMMATYRQPVQKQATAASTVSSSTKYNLIMET